MKFNEFTGEGFAGLSLMNDEYQPSWVQKSSETYEQWEIESEPEVKMGTGIVWNETGSAYWQDTL